MKAAKYIVGSSESAASQIAEHALTKFPAHTPLKDSRLSNTGWRKGSLQDILRDAILTEAVHLRKGGAEEGRIPSSLKELSPAARENLALVTFNAAMATRIDVVKNGVAREEQPLLKSKTTSKLLGGTETKILIDGAALEKLKTDKTEQAKLVTARHDDSFITISDALKHELKIRAIADTVIANLRRNELKVDRFTILPATKEKTAHTISDTIRDFLGGTSLAHTNKAQDTALAAAISKPIVDLQNSKQKWWKVNNMTAENVIMQKREYVEELTKYAPLQAALDAIRNPQPAPRQDEQKENSQAGDIVLAPLSPKSAKDQALPSAPTPPSRLRVDTALTDGHEMAAPISAVRVIPTIAARPSAIHPATIRTQAEAKTAEHSR